MGMLLLKGTSKWCDMGSQVLSALNCDGDHPNACTSGHGMHSRGTDFPFHQNQHFLNCSQLHYFSRF